VAGHPPAARQLAAHELGARSLTLQPSRLERDPPTRAARGNAVGRRGGSAAGVAAGAGGNEKFRAAAPSSLSKPGEALSPVLAAGRVAALVNLLEAFHELRDSLRAGDSDTFREGGLLLASHEGRCQLLRRGSACTCVLSGVAELERLLARMRSEEPRLRWHVVAYFVDVERRGRWERRRTGPRRLRRLSPLVRRSLLVRDPRADRELALTGVRWLAERWDLRDVRGELVNPWLVAPGLDARIFERLASVHSPPLRSSA